MNFRRYSSIPRAVIALLGVCLLAPIVWSQPTSSGAPGGGGTGAGTGSGIGAKPPKLPTTAATLPAIPGPKEEVKSNAAPIPAENESVAKFVKESAAYLAK